MNKKNLSENNIRYGFFAAFLIIFIFLIGCGEDSSSVSSVKGEAFVASVNDKKLTLEEFEKKLNLEKKKFRLEGKSSLKAEELLWLKTHALNQLIQEELMIQEASKYRIQVSDEEFKKVLDEI
ncbi:MAG: SurA N-terminal domain-containing protein [Candidatus Marinimicrobia bacterium]|nr:SurA N-terminal domain-containing protein [Candidatus Neomarinimicrobiota bacterium]